MPVAQGSGWRWIALGAVALLALFVSAGAFATTNGAQAQQQTPSLTATTNAHAQTVNLTLANGPDPWYFRIINNWWGSCTAVSGTDVNNIGGYKGGPHTVRAYSDSGCGIQIATASFTIPDPPAVSLSATVQSDRSVNLALANGPDPWYFRIGWGSCTAVSGSTTVTGIRGYATGSYGVGAFYGANCTGFLAAADFVIPPPPDPPQNPPSLTATVDAGDLSVDLELANGPTDWWFRINWWGSCTAAPGTTVSNIQGYQVGTHPVTAYSDSSCATEIDATTFTIPEVALKITVNDDRSVDLRLEGWPNNWWFRIGWHGTCTAASGSAVSGISGYQSGSHFVRAYSASGCASQIAAESFTIPTATLATTVNSDRSVDLTLTGGPPTWWFRINWWGSCTAASGTTVSNIQGYKSGTHAVWAYSGSGCSYHMATAAFTLTIKPGQLPAPTLTPGNATIGVAWTAPAPGESAITDYDVRIRQVGATDWSYVFINAASYSPGDLGNSKRSQGSAGRALNLGNVSITGLTITKVTTGGISNVYKIDEAIGGFGLRLNAKSGGNNTYEARYAPTAPTTSTMNSHGTQMWTQSSGTGSYFNRVAWTAALPAGAHFWISTTGNTNTRTDALRPTVIADTATPSTRTAQATGLTNGTSYEVQVRAVNSHGAGAWSSTATLKAGVPARSSAPTLVSGDQQLAVTWTAPANNGSAITDYDLRYSDDGGATWTLVEMDAAANTARAYTITGLTNDTAYVVQVRATNTHGDGRWSPSASLKAGAPDAPAAPTLASGDATLTATWTAPADDNGSAVTDYDLRYSSDSGATWTFVEMNAAANTALSYDVTGLTNDTSYQVQVRATNDRASGPWSPSATDKPGRPQAPSTPTLTAGARQLTATWTGTANGSPITDYDVQYRKSGATDWTTWAHTGTALTATITGLLGVEDYEVRVRAESAAGEGPWSAAAELATNAGKPDAPDTPSLNFDTAAQVTVTWTAPSHDGGATITDYDLQYCSTGCTTASNWTFVEMDAAANTARSYTITSLTTGAEYDVQVRATNTHGDGPWSATAQGAVGGPDQVASLTVTAGDTELALSWTAPSGNGNAIDDYDVRYRQEGTTSWNRIMDGGSVGAGVQFGADSTNNTDPLDFGSLGSNFSREAISGNNGVYKALNAIDEMELNLRATNCGSNGQFTARTSTMAAKPTDLSVGAALGTSSTGASPTLARGWVGPIAKDHYFWASGSMNCTNRSRTIYGVDLATTATSYTIGSLTNDTEYEVQVRAGNSNGDGQWSAAVRATPQKPSLEATGITSVSATLTVYRHNGDWWYKATSGPHASCSDAVSATATTVTGLRGDTAYTYTAYTDSGCSTAHGSATFTTGAAVAPDALAAPTLTTGNASLSAAWTAPASDGGAAVSDYDLRYREVNTSTWNPALISPATYSPGSQGNQTSNGPTGTAINLGSAANIATALGLTVTEVTTGGIDNVYRIAEAVGAFRLALSAAEGGTGATYVARYAPTAPTTSTMTTHGTLLWTRTVGSGGNPNGSAWTPGALPAGAHFWITTTDAANRVSSLVAPTVQVDAVTVPATLAATLGSLTNGKTYEVQVRAANSAGQGSWSSSGTVKAGLPAQPAAPTLVPGAAQMTVSWPAATDNGTAITDYDLRYSDDSGATWTTLEMDATANTNRSYTITSLTNDTSYQVQLRATNTHGDSLWSPSASAVVGAPDPPAAPTLTPADGQVTATWTAPANNGSAITGYDVEYSTDGATWSDANVTVTVSTRTATITGLTNGTAYQVRVRATNARGNGGWSPATTLATLTVSAITENSATLTFATGSHTGNWYLKETAPTTGTCSSVIAATTTTHDLSTLTRNTAYTYQAYSDSGCATAIAFITFTTLPSTLTASSASYTTATLTIGNHTGAWYVKQAAPATGTCSSAISGTTHSLSSLTDGARHRYDAYSDAACTTQIARGGTFDTTLYAPTNVSHSESCAFFVCTSSASWSRNSSTTGSVGYEMQAKTFGTPTWTLVYTINPTTNASLSHSGTLGPQFDARVRAFRTTNGVTIYSAWVE